MRLLPEEVASGVLSEWPSRPERWPSSVRARHRQQTPQAPSPRPAWKWHDDNAEKQKVCLLSVCITLEL